MTQPIRIMHTIDTLSAGGAERVLVELVVELHRRGEAVGVCVTRQGTQMASALPSSVPLLVLNRTRTWDVSAVRTFCRFCRSHSVSILHAHGRSTTKFCSLIKAISPKRMRLVFHDHYGDIAVDQRGSPALQFISKALVDHYAGVSPELHRWALLSLRFDPARASILGNSIDLSRFNAAKLSQKLPIQLVTQPLRAAIVGNLKPQKDHLLLFRALGRTKIARKKLHVFVVGREIDPAYSLECERVIQELQLGKNVTFLGERTNIPSLLSTMDFGLLSSRSESGPLAVLEYLAAGLPFLATRTGQIAEEVARWGIGLFTRPGHVEEYAKCLDKMVEMGTQERAEAVSAGRELVVRLFDLTQRVDQLQQIYEGLSCASSDGSARRLVA